ncbi:MAG: AMP-binding protein, partial [Candidatus Cloacimonadaceae bacterium]|nr:AMP-binding protein [Candidatus Cloacimonadaceae bacterium]
MLHKIIDHLNNSDNVAFVINDVKYNYREVRELVKKYYYYLASHPELRLIGIVMRNDIETYALLIATFLSNCGYVILNLNNPFERNLVIINEAKLRVILSSAESDKSSLPDDICFVSISGLKSVDLDIEFSIPDEDSIAYVLFTSGSTGNPKGVRISKKNVNAFLRSLDSTPISVKDTDSSLQMYDLTFDASILMLLPTLCAGGTVYTTILTKMKLVDIARVLSIYPISYLFLVPSVIALLKTYVSSISIPSLRLLLVGGEPVTKTLLDIFKPSVPNASIWNFYGPTEATVGVVIGRIDDIEEEDLYNDIIPIGEPMPGVKHILLDDETIVKEKDIKGELLVGGDQITEGYVNDESKNREAFYWVDFNGSHERFYRTGDIVYLDKHGKLSYCGRKDHQVKIQGYRIELSEIENLVRTFTGSQAVAFVKEVSGNQQLYLVVENYEGCEDKITKHL